MIEPLRLRIWLVPLAFFQLYLTVVLALFFVGPWPWLIPNPWFFASYMVCAQGFVLAGYLAMRPLVVGGETNPAPASWPFKVALLVSLAMAVPTSMARTGELLPDIITGLRDPSAAYSGKLAYIAATTSFRWVEYLRFATAAFQIALLPLTIVTWQRVNYLWRVTAVLTLAYYLSIYVASAQSKGLADLIVLCPLFLLLPAARSGWRPTVRATVGALAAAVALGAALLAFFSRI